MPTLTANHLECITATCYISPFRPKDAATVLAGEQSQRGQQRYGSNTWSGDIGSSFENLQKQVPAALNFSLSSVQDTWSASRRFYPIRLGV